MDYYITTGVSVYQQAKVNGASPYGALTLLVQSALESGYVLSEASRQNNFFRIMGGPGNLKTSHGTFQFYGTIENGINGYFNLLSQRRPMQWALTRGNCLLMPYL